MNSSTTRHRQRSRARAIAVQGLYQFDIASRGSLPMRGVDDLDTFVRQSSDDATVVRTALSLLDGVLSRLGEVDAHIERAVEHWRPERIAVLDRAVLRLAVFELLESEDVPPKVAIDEGIELAKRFSTAQSGAFVNGILDRVYRTLVGGRPESASPRADTNAARGDVALRDEDSSTQPVTD